MTDQNPACPLCGGEETIDYAILTTDKGCIRTGIGFSCKKTGCIEQRVAERKRTQKERSERAIAKAIEDGVIDP